MTVKIQSGSTIGDRIMKYSDVVQDSYSEHIGSISVLGQELQLCDHMQNIDNFYFATTFILSVENRAVMKEAGARFGTLSDGSHAVYITEDMLAVAKPLRENDEMTQAMIKRMIAGLTSANKKKHSKYA
jgi:hypothetical protein